MVDVVHVENESLLVADKMADYPGFRFAASRLRFYWE
jgi:hypothetical protein